MLEKFMYEPATETIRSVPENYWVASVLPNLELRFDSWDKAIVGRYDEKLIRNQWKATLAKHGELRGNTILVSNAVLVTSKTR